MKALLRIGLALSICMLVAKVSFADDFTFRKTRWGMSMDEVKASETLEVARQEADLLVYEAKVINKDVFILYRFVGNKLTRAKYFLNEKHMNNNDFIADYNDFKEILKKKYGEPKEDNMVWKNNLYKGKYSGWGTAISMGHLVYFSTWETESSEIINSLSGDNFKIICLVEYGSKEFKELEMKAKESKSLELF